MKNIKALVLMFLSIISMVNVSNALAEASYHYDSEIIQLNTNMEAYLSVEDTFDFILDGTLAKTITPSHVDSWRVESLKSPVVEFDNGLFITADSIRVDNIIGRPTIHILGAVFSDSSLPKISSMSTVGGRVPLGSSFEDVLAASSVLVFKTGIGSTNASYITYIGAVPEPSSYALLLAGLGLLFFRKAKNNRL